MTKKLMRRLCWALAIVLLAVTLTPTHTPPASPGPVRAQSDDDACNGLVAQALELVATNCLALGTNEVCYGYDTVSATLNDSTLFFDRPGDIVPVTALQTLNTGNINPATGEWGIAVMDIQADLPDQNNVRLLMFGGAQVEPAATDTTTLQTCPFSNTAGTAINLRATPGPNGRVTDVLAADATLDVYGSNADGTWLRSARGWVRALDGSLTCDDALPTMDSSADAFPAPMQAFAVRVDASAQCESIPSGMLIQTPSGQTAALQVNGVEMQVGSTAILTFDEEGDCQTISSIDGDVDIVGQNTPLPVGGQVSVPAADNTRDCYRDGESYRPVVQTIDGNTRALVPELTGDSAPRWRPRPPRLKFTANAATGTVNIDAGSCVLLDWTVSDAADVFLNGSSVAPGGQREVCPAAPTNYVLSAVALSDTLDDVDVRIRVVPGSTTADNDGDGVPNADDNCPNTPNRNQIDTNLNRVGDACERQDGIDDDGDGVSNRFDTCPVVSNSAQGADDDCLDTAISDLDNDGIPDYDDNCPDIVNPNQFDRDGNGIGDNCEPAFSDFDADGDSVDDFDDNCPFTFNPAQMDSDGDGIGDLCSDFGEFSIDFDYDGDGVDDFDDNCPDEPNPDQTDSDGDGLGDACADFYLNDSDGDGVPDLDDICPFIPNPDQDDPFLCDDFPAEDLDLIFDDDANPFGDIPFGNNPFADDPFEDDPFEDDGVLGVDDEDGDGVPDVADGCPLDAGPPETFGCPDNDFDGDGVPDVYDACPEVAGEVDNGGCAADTVVDDEDGDGVFDVADSCPFEAGPPETRGCPDDDFDEDGVPDVFDACVEEAGDIDNAGCPLASPDVDLQDDPLDDTDAPFDADEDGVPDDIDDCPDTPGLFELDGCPPDDTDIDSDGDGLIDPNDACPNEAGPADNAGCPYADSDGDGLIDPNDACPNEAGPADNAGCPYADSDGDGLIDLNDACPNEAGPADNAGCPYVDSDGDGLIDLNDACPNEAGPADNAGCPYDDSDDLPPYLSVPAASMVAIWTTQRVAW